MDNKELLTQFLSEILEVVKSGKTLVIQESPMIIEEILKWGMAKNIIWALILFSIATIFGFIVLKRRKCIDSDINVACLVAACAVFVLSALFFIGRILYIIKILVAPRLYIISYISELLSGGGI